MSSVLSEANYAAPLSGWACQKYYDILSIIDVTVFSQRCSSTKHLIEVYSFVVSSSKLTNFVPADLELLFLLVDVWSTTVSANALLYSNHIRLHA